MPIALLVVIQDACGGVRLPGNMSVLYFQTAKDPSWLFDASVIWYLQRVIHNMYTCRFEVCLY